MAPSTFLHFDEAAQEAYLHSLSDDELRAAHLKTKKSSSRSMIYGVLTFCFLLLPLTACAVRVFIVEEKMKPLVFHEMESRGMEFLKGPMWDDLHEDLRDGYESGKIRIDDWEDVEDLRRRGFPIERIREATRELDEKKKKKRDSKAL